MDTNAIASIFANNSQPMSRSVASDKGKSSSKKLQFNDPLLRQQWYLHNTGQTEGTPGIDLNVLPVWKDYTGAGVRVGVVDDGVDYRHTDLRDNYDDTRDFDADKETDDASPVSEYDNHGTAVAGIIAGKADNGAGGVGVAFGSTISGIRLNFESEEDWTRQDLNALGRFVDFDVVNNSWNFRIPFEDNFLDSPTFAQYQERLENAVLNGRDGLGTAIVFSAGNDREAGDDANHHNLSNSRHTITVAALNHNGVHTYYSNPGASLLVSAFGGENRLNGDGIVTVDRQGQDGYTDEDYTPAFGGTSAAAPMVTGVIALMLEANPDLGYRDIQEILAYSARQTDATDQSWQFNGASNWNGGGLHTSRNYGFGLVDAHAAVRLAETWNKQSTAHNEWSQEGSASPDLVLGDIGSVSSQITLDYNMTIDQIEVDVDIDHGRIGELELVLISPNGTESVLMLRPGATAENPNGVEQSGLRFTFSSTQFWGEDAAGTWTLVMRDRITGEEGVLKDWSLRAFGDVPDENDTYIYTNEFAKVGDELSRGLLQDSWGYDVLNAAAVTGDLDIKLAAGRTSTIAGRTLEIDWGTVIEAAIGGDGSDRIFGNGVDNALYGMRGKDTLRGVDGDDWLVGGKGDDILRGGKGDDLLAGGAGSDKFYFGGYNIGVDTILDFQSGHDKILLDGDTFSAIFNGVGPLFSVVENDFEADYSDGMIVYSRSTGNLFYNPTGSLPELGDGGQFATISGAPALSSQDFVVA